MEERSWRLHFHTIPPLLSTMPDKIDISTAATWRGLRPGMTRAEAMRVLGTSAVEIDDDANDPGWLLVHADEWGIELRFEESGEERLRQIVLDDWECTWAGREFCNRPLHEALVTLGDAGREAGWRAEDAVNESFEDLQPPSPEGTADEDLLGEGTVWLRSRGIGLVMCDGAVNEVVWRRPEDVPAQLLGPVTDAQREITKRADLEDHLSKLRVSKSVEARKTSSASNPVQKLLTLLFIAALGWVGWQGLQETQRWQTAQTLTGKLARIDKATSKPWIDHYVIEYTDPAGHAQTASVERGGFYVPPNAIGEETKIAWLAGNPPRVKGPAHARDSAFLEYVPWFIGVCAVYMVLWSIAGFVGRLMRNAAAARPPGRPAPPPSATPGPPPPFTPDRGR